MRIRCLLRNYRGELLVDADAQRPTIKYRRVKRNGDIAFTDVPRRTKDPATATFTCDAPTKRGDLVSDPGAYARKVLAGWRTRTFALATFETFNPVTQTWRSINIHTLK